MLLSPLSKVTTELDSALLPDSVKNLCESHPISSALGKDGPFTTSYKRREFMKARFSVVDLNP